MSLKHRGTGIESRATNILFFVLWLQIIWDGLVKYIVMRGSISCEPSMWNAYCIVRLKRDGTRTETRFRLSAKRTSPFKSAGASVPLTAGSRGVRISGSNAGYTTFWGSVKSTGYQLHSPVPLHFLSRAAPCAITFQLDSSQSDILLYFVDHASCSDCNSNTCLVINVSFLIYFNKYCRVWRTYPLTYILVSTHNGDESPKYACSDSW